nr:MAG TPA: hypothetical protein [Caudoviricetes sp.]
MSDFADPLLDFANFWVDLIHSPKGDKENL